MMVYQAFFVLCVIAVAVASILSSYRARALVCGAIGFAVAYLLEVRGAVRDEWDYAGVDSLLKLTGIPIEILFGYFAAAFFLFLVIAYLPGLHTEEARTRAVQCICLLVGIVLLAHTYMFSSMSLAVGWAFLGLFGLSISRDGSVPLTVGMLAFFADWVVEGTLNSGMAYYAGGWDPTIGLVFMFAAMFITGVATHLGLVEKGLPWGRARDDGDGALGNARE